MSDTQRLPSNHTLENKLRRYISRNGLKIRREGRVVRLVERNTSRRTGQLVIREINTRRKRVKVLLSA